MTDSAKSLAPSRRTLRYPSPEALASDVALLQQGYAQAGNWNLPQACWHLRVVTEALLARPMSDPTPEMVARRPLMEAVLAGQPLPAGLPCPEEFVPPADADPVEVDRFLQLVERMRTHLPFKAMHRVFGPVNSAELQRLFLAHCSNHLGHLVPTTGGN